MKHTPMIDFDAISDEVFDPMAGLHRMLKLPEKTPRLLAPAEAASQRIKPYLPGETFLTPRKTAQPELTYTPREVTGFRYLSDTRRVEIGLLPYLMFITVKRGASTEYHQTYVDLTGLLTDAITETVHGLPTDKVDYLAKRLIREGDAVYFNDKGGYFSEDWTNAKIAMVLYFLACDLTSRGIMELVEGSSLADALALMWTCVEDEAAEKPLVVKSAEKQSEKFLRFLQGKHYFSN